jgi:hypothetical protein
MPVDLALQIDQSKFVKAEELAAIYLLKSVPIWQLIAQGCEAARRGSDAE